MKLIIDGPMSLTSCNGKDDKGVSEIEGKMKTPLVQ